MSHLSDTYRINYMDSPARCLFYFEFVQNIIKRHGIPLHIFVKSISLRFFCVQLFFIKINCSYFT